MWTRNRSRRFESQRSKSCSFQNLSVELQLESHAEFSHDNFKAQVDKAAGARYGTGVRDLWSNSQKNDLKRCFFKLTSSRFFDEKFRGKFFCKLSIDPLKSFFWFVQKLTDSEICLFKAEVLARKKAFIRIFWVFKFLKNKYLFERKHFVAFLPFWKIK